MPDCKQESGFDVSARSRAGALGLMQLMPATARQVAASASEPAPADILEVQTNLRLGIRLLSNLLRENDGDVIDALSSYNAGPDRKTLWRQRWGHLPAEVFVELIPFEETRGYVKTVLRNYAFYKLIEDGRSITLNDLWRMMPPS